jgi:hypothetical protein
MLDIMGSSIDGRGVARLQARPAMAWGMEANLFVNCSYRGWLEALAYPNYATDWWATSPLMPGLVVVGVLIMELNPQVNLLLSQNQPTGAHKGPYDACCTKLK